MSNAHTSHRDLLHESSSPLAQTYLLTFLLWIYESSMNFHRKQTERRHSDLQKIFAWFAASCNVFLLKLDVEFSVRFSTSYQDCLVLGYIQEDSFFSNKNTHRHARFLTRWCFHEWCLPSGKPASPRPKHSTSKFQRNISHSFESKANNLLLWKSVMLFSESAVWQQYVPVLFWAQSYESRRHKQVLSSKEIQLHSYSF